MILKALSVLQFASPAMCGGQLKSGLAAGASGDQGNLSWAEQEGRKDGVTLVAHPHSGHGGSLNPAALCSPGPGPELGSVESQKGMTEHVPPRTVLPLFRVCLPFPDVPVMVLWRSCSPRACPARALHLGGQEHGVTEPVSAQTEPCSFGPCMFTGHKEAL